MEAPSPPIAISLMFERWQISDSIYVYEMTIPTIE
jgi:hypothetical protein